METKEIILYLRVESPDFYVYTYPYELNFKIHFNIIFTKRGKHHTPNAYRQLGNKGPQTVALRTGM